MKFSKAIISTLLLLALSYSTKAQEFITYEEITPVEHALTGFATAISGEWAIVTSPQKDVEGDQSVGGATFYQKTANGWIIAQEVLPTDATPLSNFGMSVDMDGNTAIISSIGDSENGLFSGAVYVYTYNDTSWVQTGKLKASDAGMGHRFGHAVSIVGDVIAVGAYQADGNENKSGAVYVFENTESGWQEIQKIYATEGQSHDYFGYSLDVLATSENTTIISVGAYNATGAAERSGAVFIFEQEESGWVQVSELFDLTGSSSDAFGKNVFLGCEEPIIIKTVSDASNSTLCYETEYAKLFVGAPGTNNENGQTGSVYYHTYSEEGFGIAYKIEESESASNDHFGSSMEFINNNLFVTATRTNTNEVSHIGTVYEYSLGENEATMINSFTSPNETSYGYFGTSLSADGKDLIISAPYESIEGNENAGSVYFYKFLSTSNEEVDNENVSEYKLEQNYPNPFNPSTAINYQVKEAGLVKLTVFNLLGQTIQVLVNERQNTGAYSSTFDASALSSGFYFYRLEVNDFSSTKKMMLIK